MPMPATQICVCPGVTGKKRDGVTQPDGDVLENAGPRHWHATCLMFVTLCSQDMCRTCFVLCGVFSMKSNRPHIDLGRNRRSPPFIQIFPTSALVASRTSTCPERRQVRCCRTHLNFAKFLFRRCWSRRTMPDRKLKLSFHYTVCCRLLLVLLPFFCVRSPMARRRPRPFFFGEEEEVFLRFPRVVFFMHVFFFFENFCWVKTRSCMRLATSQSWDWTEQHQS